MPMYNLLEYSSNYSETRGSLWFYSKDEATNFNNDIANTNSFKSFRYRADLLGNTEVDAAYGILRNTTIAVSLNYLPLIGCEVELKLKWTSHCVLSALGSDNADPNSSNIILTIKDTKLYVPVVTLSAKDNQKLNTKE